MNIYDNRKYIVSSIFILIAIIFISRLFFMQIIDSSYRVSAENNSRRFAVKYPDRGLIFDRNGKLLVYNEASYDLVVIPKQIQRFDTLELCNLIGMTPVDMRRQIEKAAKSNKYRPTVIAKQITKQQYAYLQEKLYKFPGFSMQKRSLRKYIYNVASMVFGYVSEVDKYTVRSDNYYDVGDYAGASGIESAYEKALRGVKGVSISLVDVNNRIQGSYKHGEFDKEAVVGANITSSIDIDLQAYGEELMQNKRGSIVAIEPSTGEILALITSPSYEPSLLVGQQRSANFVRLSQDNTKPLFNRALMAQYPPGSTFKLINSLIGLQEGAITTSSVFNCYGGFHLGRFSVGCHHNGAVDFTYAIQGSCNAYFCNVFQRIIELDKFATVSESYENWRNHVLSFGIGGLLHSDLDSELPGFIPQGRYYDKYYGKNRWRATMLISMAIGQGELGITPFQMANMTAAIANRGYYYIPHVVKKISTAHNIDSRFLKRQYTTISPMYFEPVIDGMELVVLSGTATVANIPGISVCGKTGTAQNAQGQSHSIFVAFAPKFQPQIAIAVYVENGGPGSLWAAPIASLLIEKYMNGKVIRKELEERILNGIVQPDGITKVVIPD